MRVAVSCIHYLGTRWKWVVNITPRSLYLLEIIPVPVE